VPKISHTLNFEARSEIVKEMGERIAKASKAFGALRRLVRFLKH